MKSKPRLRVLLPVALLALLGIGAGAFAFTGTPGGGSDPLPASKRPVKTAAPMASHATWVKRANAICARLDRDGAALGTPQSREQLVALLPQSLELASQALADLRALPTARHDRRKVGRMLDLFGRFIAVERDAVDALAAEDDETFVRTTGQAFALNDRGNRIARELGAVRCADEGTADTKLAAERRAHRVVVAVLYSPDADLDNLAIREARAAADEAGAGFVAINVYEPKEIAPVTVAYPVRATPSVLVYTRSGGAVSLFQGYVDRETVAQAAENAAL